MKTLKDLIDLLEVSGVPLTDIKLSGAHLKTIWEKDKYNDTKIIVECLLPMESLLEKKNRSAVELLSEVTYLILGVKR